MEVDGGNNSKHGTPNNKSNENIASKNEVVVTSSGSSGSVSVKLHPLVIMNMSEHWTRIKVQNSSPQKVFGAIIGKQKGRNIEVMNSFELATLQIEGHPVIDTDYYKMKEEQFKQVFSEMDILGWYSTGECPRKEDVDVHKQILDVHESPLFIQMNPGAKALQDIPISMYESSMDLVEGEMGQEARLAFIKLEYDLATEDSERIGLDHVARISSTTESTQSKVSENLMVQHSAIKMLTSRVDIILNYIEAVEKKELPFNHEVLREAKALADRLPILASKDRFTPEFYTQCNDVALMTLMGSVHKSSNDLMQFVNKFNVAHPKESSGRRMRGMYM